MFGKIRASRDTGQAMLTLLFAAAMAAPDATTPAPRVVHKRTTVINFNELLLVGEITRPQMSRSMVRGKARFGNLVRARIDMQPELDRSVEALSP